METMDLPVILCRSFSNWWCCFNRTKTTQIWIKTMGSLHQVILRVLILQRIRTWVRDWCRPLKCLPNLSSRCSLRRQRCKTTMIMAEWSTRVWATSLVTCRRHPVKLVWAETTLISILLTTLKISHKCPLQQPLRCMVGTLCQINIQHHLASSYRFKWVNRGMWALCRDSISLKLCRAILNSAVVRKLLTSHPPIDTEITKISTTCR